MASALHAVRKGSGTSGRPLSPNPLRLADVMPRLLRDPIPAF
jgi:hypothetical protein